MRTRWSAIAGALVALVTATSIYFLWRDGTWLHRACPSLHHVLRPLGAASPIPDWARFSLPDALWQYAFTALVLAIWSDRRWTWRKNVFVALSLALGCGHELAQLARIAPGTFDALDLMSSLATFVAVLLLHGGVQRSGHRTPDEPRDAPPRSSAAIETLGGRAAFSRCPRGVHQLHIAP